MRRTPQFLLAALVLGTLALAGCADPSADSGSGGDDAVQTSASVIPEEPTAGGTDRFPPLTTPTTPPPPSAPAVPAEVTITVDDGAGTVTEYTLTCQPPGGTHPNAADACSTLAAGTSALGPPDPNQACTEIYGGPQTATVSGTLNGAPLEGTFGRADGCQIARWDRLAALFAPAAGLD